MGDRVEAEIEFVDLPTDRGGTCPGTRATCDRCGHTTESFGQGVPSVKRCLALLREECPEDESNYYVAAGGEDEDL